MSYLTRCNYNISERIIEDHEKLIAVMMNWQKISNNKILFLETDDKYDLFFQPQVRTTADD